MKVIWAAAATAAVGLRVYNYMTGQNALLDWWDWRRLSSLSLAQALQQWRTAPKSSLVCCLSTIPSRVEHLEHTVKSLLCQRPAPLLIRLHLPEWSRREDCAYVLPPWVAGCEAVQVVTCADQGPATKLLPALRELPPEQPLLVVDDDMIYPPGFVAHFERLAQLHPDQAVGSSGWRVPADLTDRPTTLRSNLLRQAPTPVKCTRLKQPWRTDILQGYSGYCLRPRHVDPAVHDPGAAPAGVFYVDDVWISAHVRAPKWVHPAARYPFPPPDLAALYKSSSLGLINRGGGDPEQRNNTIAIRYLRGVWLIEIDPAL